MTPPYEVDAPADQRRPNGLTALRGTTSVSLWIRRLEVRALPRQHIMAVHRHFLVELLSWNKRSVQPHDLSQRRSDGPQLSPLKRRIFLHSRRSDSMTAQIRMTSWDRFARSELKGC
jgi:hypothetical protein